MASSPLRARGMLPACALLALVALVAFAPAAKADGEYDPVKVCEYKEEYSECDSPAAKEKCVKATCQKDEYGKVACKPTNETYCMTEDKCNPAKCVYGECKYEPIKCKDPEDPCKKAKCLKGYCVEENEEDGTECDLKSKKPNKCVVGKCEYGYCKEFEKECEFDDDYDEQCLEKAGYCDPKKGCVDNKYKKDGTACEKDDDLCSLERCYKGKCEVYDEKKCKFPKYDDDCMVSEGKCDPEYGCREPEYKEDGTECDTDYNKCTLEKCEKGRCKKDGKKKCEYEYDYDDVCVKKPGYCDAKEGCKEPEYYDDGYECDTDGNMCTVEKCKEGKCVKDDPPVKECEYDEDYDKECVKVEGYCDPRKGCIKRVYVKDGTVCERDNDKCSVERCYKGICIFKGEIECKFPKYDDECVEEPADCDPDYGCISPKLKEDGTECNKDKNKCYDEKCLNGKCVKYGKKKCDDDGDYDKQCVKKAAYCNIKEGCIATEFWEEGYECDTDYNVCTVEKCDGYGKCVKEKDLKCEEYEYDAECLKKAPYCDRKKGCMKPIYNNKCTKKVGYKKVTGHCNEYGKCEVEEQPYEEEAKSGKRLF